MRSNISAHAISYLALGWSIFPLHTPVGEGLCSCIEHRIRRGDVDPVCDSVGKHPRLGRGVLEASREVAVVRDWWRRWPDANIGLATGEPSGIWVLDLDTPEALGLIEAELGFSLPATVAAKTGRGRHLYWRLPEGIAIANRAGVVKGVDVRGNGGYVVAPPSLHYSGAYYEWEEDTPDEVIEAPAGLLELVRKPASKPMPKLATVDPVEVLKRGNDGGRTEKYIESALKKAFEAVAGAGEGSRNATLNKEAYSLAGLDISHHEITATLLDAARRAGLPEQESLRTIQSGLRSGSSKPREIPQSSLPVRQSQPSSRALREVPPPPPSDILSEDDIEEDFGSLNFTDTGNAERFLRDHAADVRYCAEAQRWFCWDGIRWLNDRTNEIQRKAKVTVGKIKLEEIDGDDEAAQKKRQQLWQWAIKSESAERRSAMVRLASVDSLDIQVVPEQLDSDQWVLNVANGLVDLRDGTLRPHTREVLCTKLAPIAYDPEAKCPRWEQFLLDTQGGDAEMVNFLQRAIGYALTGDTREQCVFFLYGTGSNGKSTLLDTLRKLLSDYGAKAEFATFMKRQTVGEPRNDLAALRGARFVSASESEGGQQFAEAFLKDVTGGEAVKCRFLHEEFFEYTPQFKLFLASNAKPVIKGTDKGIWRRIRLIPFEQTFEGDRKDKDLGKKLEEELPGILAWAVRGCLLWQKEGLEPPEKVMDATQGYKEEMDVLGDFIAQKCKLGASENAPMRGLYKLYKSWAADEETEAIGEKAFFASIQGRGIKRVRKGTSMVFAGISAEGLAIQKELM